MREVVLATPCRGSRVVEVEHADVQLLSRGASGAGSNPRLSRRVRRPSRTGSLGDRHGTYACLSVRTPILASNASHRRVEGHHRATECLPAAGRTFPQSSRMTRDSAVATLAMK